jgi:hypothetical protein
MFRTDPGYTTKQFSLTFFLNRNSNVTTTLTNSQKDYYKMHTIDKQITDELCYSDIGLSDTLAIASDTLWYQLIPRKARVFLPRLEQYTLSYIMTLLLIGSNLWFLRNGPFWECN